MTCHCRSYCIQIALSTNLIVNRRLFYQANILVPRVGTFLIHPTLLKTLCMHFTLGWLIPNCFFQISLSLFCVQIMVLLIFTEICYTVGICSEHSCYVTECNRSEDHQPSPTIAKLTFV